MSAERPAGIPVVDDKEHICRMASRVLERIGVLTPHKVGRENLYLNVRLYDLLAK